MWGGWERREELRDASSLTIFGFPESDKQSLRTCGPTNHSQEVSSIIFVHLRPYKRIFLILAPRNSVVDRFSNMNFEQAAQHLLNLGFIAPVQQDSSSADPGAALPLPDLPPLPDAAGAGERDSSSLSSVSGGGDDPETPNENTAATNMVTASSKANKAVRKVCFC